MTACRWPHAIAFSVLFAVAARAQEPQAQGAIGGTVFDPVSAPAARAPVIVTRPDGKAAGQVTSDAAGRYVLADLPPGAYDVRVAIPGLKAWTQKAVTVTANATTVLDIHLEEGSQLSTLGEDAAGVAADRKRHAPPAGPTPRTVDGKPDFSGVWWQPVTTVPGRPEWLAAAQQVASERQANNRKDSPQVRCLPAPVLRRGPVFEFVQSKAVIIEVSDDDSPGFHHIYLSGHEHPKNPDPLWYGDSVGRWDGDTLVVDRVNFVPDVWLDQDAHPHSDKLHVIERYRRPDLGHLETQVTVEDPGVLKRPWTFTRVAELAPTEEVREFICAENNSDLSHLVGQ